jgi:hypothetical protein
MTRSRLRHIPACVLILAACADDAATQDTDASSSSETGDEDPTDPDPTTDTEPDPDSSSSTDDPTADTTTPDESSSESGGTCVIPMYAFDDASFEGGAMTAWGNASSAFPTPLCDASCGDAAMPQDGAWFVWLGGTPSGDTGGVSQVVTLTEADELTLTFYFWWQAVGSGTDIFQLQVDGDVLWEIGPDNQAEYTAGWTEVTVDISAYADGGDHDFDFTGFASANGNLFLDNIQTSGCDAGSGVTATDTVDPIATGGETDSETDPTGGMLTCEDLGNTLPIAQAGNNADSGDDVVGSCLIGGGDGAGLDVGYTWTAPEDGIYRFDTLGSALDTVLILLEDCEGGAEVACNDDASGATLQSSLIYTMTMGQTVAIAIDGWSSGDVDDFVLNINQIGCDDPVDLGNNLPIEQDDDNMGAGDDVSASCGGNGGEDVVYTWTPQEDGIYSIYAVSLQMAPVVSAYAGTCGAPGDELGCAAGNGLAAFNAVLVADQEISIVVDGADADAVGSYELNIEQAGVLAGDCCAADDSAGCESAATTQCVCGADIGDLAGAFDPAQCCAGDWTEACAGLAQSQCDAGCDTVDGGSCCDGESGAPGCDTMAVEECTCALDEYCCDTEWDAVCVEMAQTFCFATCQ